MRLVVLMVEVEQPEGISARKLVLETARHNPAALEAVVTNMVIYLHVYPFSRYVIREINGLRGDRNECVRLEAALALGRGCCCSRPVLEALVRTVSGDDRDGFPTERSPRVLAAAQQACSTRRSNHALCAATNDTPSSIGASQGQTSAKVGWSLTSRQVMPWM